MGPLISSDARARVEAHLETMRARGARIWSTPLPEGRAAEGWFAPLSVVEIAAVCDLEGEVFGPVLHVVRFARNRLDALLEEIAAKGYGLTFAVHSRIDETIARALARARAGNLYVNRNMIGAVVGSQPFGGLGLSGTGPKAGGPLYLRRLFSHAPRWAPPRRVTPRRATQRWAALSAEALAWRAWLREWGTDGDVARFDDLCARSPSGEERELPGPAGERNVWSLAPRGLVLCAARDRQTLIEAAGAAIATGAKLAMFRVDAATLFGALPPPVSVAILDHSTACPIEAVLFEGDDASCVAMARSLADRDGPITPLHRLRPGKEIALEWLTRECATSVNVAAAGGSISLMALE